MIPSDRIAILAAGKGERMNSGIPKVLHQLYGKPMLWYVVQSAREANGTKPILVVNAAHRDAIAHVLHDEVEYAVQLEPQGTADAVRAIPPALVEGSSHLVVLYGDHPLISTPTIRRLIQAHAAAHAPLTMMTVMVPHFEEAYEAFEAFGRIIRQSDGTLDRIVEYRDADEAIKKIKEVNPGYYCFSLSWLQAHLPQVRAENAQKEFYLTDLVGIARRAGEAVAVVPIDDPWEGLGVNTQEALALAAQIIASRDAGAKTEAFRS
ncbi:MAG: NTP transferase domain-containing protein [Patescibacteria group bacterium]